MSLPLTVLNAQQNTSGSITSNHIYSIGKKSGIVDLKSNMLTPPDYIEIAAFSEGCYAASRNTGTDTLFGYLNEKGVEICDFRFYDAYPFRNGMAAVKTAKINGWTFIDRQFNFITEQRFAGAMDFYEGYAAVKLETGKWTFADKSGKLITSASFDRVGSFSNGFAMIFENGKFGYIHKTGELRIPPRFTHYRDFSMHQTAAVADELMGWKLIDTAGNFIPREKNIALEYPHVFDNGLFKVASTDSKGVVKMGYMNLKNEIIIPLIYDDIAGFHHHNLAGGIIGKVNFLVREDGKVMAKTRFSQIHYYYAGPVAMVYQNLNSSDMQKLKLKIGDTDYEYIHSNGLMGAINGAGNLTIPVVYKELGPLYSQDHDTLYGNQCLFTALRPNSKYKGVISDDNKILVPFSFEEIQYLCNDAFLTQLNGKHAIYRAKSGKLIKLNDVDVLYVTGEELKKYYIIAKIAGTKCTGLMDIEGNWLIEPRFDQLKKNIKKDKREG